MPAPSCIGELSSICIAECYGVVAGGVGAYEKLELAGLGAESEIPAPERDKLRGNLEAHLAALAKYPDIEVIEGGIDNDNIETAQQQAAAVLAANPDLVGYLNCDACGSGVAAAIEEAGKAGQVKFVSMDNLIEILEYVKTGTITATSSTIPQMQGSMAVLMMWQASLGIDIPAKVDTGVAYIDETNIDEWIELVSASVE